jgi:hypothetical protein
LNAVRWFSQAPTVMPFLQVPGEVTLPGLMAPSPSASLPSLPAAITKHMSLRRQTKSSNCRHWSS